MPAGLRRGALFGLGVIVALAALGLHGIVDPGRPPLTVDDVNKDIARTLASQTPAPALAQQVYQAVAPSVVLIETLGPAASPAASATPVASPLTPAATAPAAPSDEIGRLGSGVIVDAAGDILTCLHVVADATSIRVTFADGTTSPAQITAQQEANDIAVLRATNPPSQLTPAVLGNPRSMQVGSEAFVVGNPFGLSDSITSGVVSGLNRSFRLPNGQPLVGLIQVDAAVNPGNSGGPLVNRDGQVVGIVSGLVNPTDQDVFIGIGLAVPIDVAGGAAGLPQY